MRARINNLIKQYETERDQLKIKPTVDMRPSDLSRLKMIDEVLRALKYLIR